MKTTISTTIETSLLTLAKQNKLKLSACLARGIQVALKGEIDSITPLEAKIKRQEDTIQQLSQRLFDAQDTISKLVGQK